MCCCCCYCYCISQEINKPIKLSEVFCCSCNLKDNIKDLFKEALDLNDVIIIVNPLKDKKIYLCYNYCLSFSLSLIQILSH